MTAQQNTGGVGLRHTRVWAFKSKRGFFVFVFVLDKCKAISYKVLEMCYLNYIKIILFHMAFQKKKLDRSR